MKYFSIEELVKSATAERLAIDNTPPSAARKMLTILVEQLLDPIRRRYGAPIIVTSGYRCPALNTAVGGVANSHHIVGCAADIVGGLPPPPPTGGGDIPPNRYLLDIIVQMQREGAIQFTQLIAEEGYRWLHISYVPGMLRNQVIDVNDNADAKGASVATAARYESAACDGGRFISPEERASAPLALASLRSATTSPSFLPDASMYPLRTTCSLAGPPSHRALCSPSGRQLTLSLSSKEALSSGKDYQDSG